jgi:iron complex outermembrane receptor protein
VQQSNTGQSEGTPIDDHLATGAFNVQASALYAFDNGISPYVSYATSFQPVTNRSASNEILDPARGQQFEAGVKYQPPGSDIFLSAAAYHLAEKNKPVLDPSDPTQTIYRSLGEVTNNGFELEGRAQIAEGWDLLAAYTYTHSEITGGDDIGNKTAVTPDHVASLWANYTFPETSGLAGLSAGGGIRYASSNYTSTENTSKNGASVYFDAAVSYDFGAINKNYSGLVAAVNVRNIADDRDTICNEGACYLQEGRNVTASIRYRW